MTMIRDSVAEPRETAERLLALRPGLGVVIQAAVLVSVVDVLVLSLLGGGAMALPAAEGQVLLPPFAHAALLLASLVLSAGALQVGGQILGGRGRFEQALLLVVWLEVIMIAVQLVTLLGALALPPLAGLLGLLGLAVLLWCLVHFTRVLHGFQGFGRTVAALLVGATAVLFALTGILAMLGVGGPPNV
jgi:hypothetical protein